MRIKRNLTQIGLANLLDVSEKTISKWETNRGLPDITLIEPLAKVLKISVTELLSGNVIRNTNIRSNMTQSKLYVCPVCGNIIHSMGENNVICCGIQLPVLESEYKKDLGFNKKEDELFIERIENEYYVSMNHPKTKEHYISFFAYMTDNHTEMIKLYPEENAEGRFFIRGHGVIYAYCNKDGLLKRKI